MDSRLPVNTWPVWRPVAASAYGHTGHGFGPPDDAAVASAAADESLVAAVLDLSSSVSQRRAAHSQDAARQSDSEGDESGTLLTLHIQSQVKVESPEQAPKSEPPVDEAADEAADSCSRTLPRIPDTWLHKLEQRKLHPPPVKAESSVSSDAEAVAVTPTPSPPVQPPHPPPSKRKAFVKPNSQNAASSAPPSATIPVGIAVARQRPEASKSRDTPPKPHAAPSPYPPAPPAPPAPPDLSVPPTAAFNYGPLPAGRMYQAPLGDWSWSDPLQMGGPHPPPLLWPGADVSSSVYGFPYGHPTPQPARPLSSGATSPFLLIPAACLDAYQRAAATAMLWSGYGPATSQPAPWNLELGHPPPSAWPHPLHLSAVVDPLSAPAPADPLYDPAVAVDPLPPSPIKSERMTPVEEVKAAPESNEDYASAVCEPLDYKPVIPEAVDRIQEPEADAVKAEAPDEADHFTGLHLLSDSIERFASAIKREEPVRMPPDASTNALDVLCAAALSEVAPQPEAPPPPPPPPPSVPNETLELDVRSKLAELQRKYKEKQKELNKLKNVKRKDKEKKDKRKEKKRSRDKAGAEPRSAAAAPAVTKSSDLITPSRLDHPAAPSPPDHRDAGETRQDRAAIKAPYAAALAAAACPASVPAPPSGGGSAKKRKSDWPKKHDQQTETIVPKTRRLLHLLQWCGQPKAKELKQRPKMKPKLKAEVQVKRPESSASSGCDSDGDETVERHCLPAMQYLQISDADSRPGSALSLRPPTPPTSAPSESPPSPPASPPPPKDSADQPPSSCDTTPPSLVPEEASPCGSTLPSCRLAESQLQDGLRVLIAEDGLLHGGCVTGICPPDIYGVVVDGERGSRPRILSTEELLTEALLEVRPDGIDQLAPGTRLCAYWSQKSRCLYPGVVSAVFPATKGAGNKHAAHEDEVDVEFDDGDSGRIPLSHIRMLPQDFPVIERPVNPLLALESRRRRPSSGHKALPATPRAATEERRVSRAESTDSAPDKKTKKSNKKRKWSDSGEEAAKGDQLIIPVSPGTEDGDEAKPREDPPAEENTLSPLSAPPPRRAAAAAAAKTKQQATTPTAPASGKSRGKVGAAAVDRQLWQWLGPSFKKASKGKGRKEFYRAIQRGQEVIRVGDCAVFLSAGRPDRPYVGRVELLWQSWGGAMTVKVRWFYHPEETCGGRRLSSLKTPGALFESNHADENDVQTISHGCQVLPLDEYLHKRKPDVNLNTDGCYDSFYLAGFYDPTSNHLSFEPGVLEPSNKATN